MVTRVFVDGQEGTTGLKIFEYLQGRDDVELLRIEESRRKESDARAAMINASDVTFLCLPDTASREAAQLAGDRVCLIDASTAFRTAPDWAYGLPEMATAQRDRIAGSKRIAVPGCHASAFVLAVRPLVDSGLIASNYPAAAHSITGYSGGGKKMIAEYEAEGAGTRPPLNGPRPYALGQTHKHLPEMKVHGLLAAEPIFTPIVASFYKGLAVTLFLQPSLMARRASLRDVHEVLSGYYRGERFIRVMPLDPSQAADGGFLDVQACNDTNRVDLFVLGNEDRMLVVARLDNLGKGASGASIQCMNLALGVAEETGLRV